MEEARRSSYCSGVPSLEDVAVELGVQAAGVVGDEGKLGIDRSGSGQGDPAQGVSHEERLHTRAPSDRHSRQRYPFKINHENSALPFHPRRIFLPL